MKRFIIVTLFALLGLLICVGLFYAAGSLWGPLYQGEDESTRNFKIFLAAAALSLLAGAGVGIWKTRNKS